MPKWSVHDKWAARFGIPQDVSTFVNRLIDMPLTLPDWREFYTL